MSEPLRDAGATIGKGSSTSLERTSGSDRSEKTGNESSTGDTLPAVTGRPNAYVGTTAGFGTPESIETTTWTRTTPRNSSKSCRVAEVGLDPTDAPILFSGNVTDARFDEALLNVARFIHGYRNIILNESKYVGTWVLDLSVSALFSQIAQWGERFDVISVHCDDSKPLRDLAPTLNVMVGRTDRTSMFLGKKRRPLTFNLAQPVQFISSTTHAGVQLADVVSSALVQAVKKPETDWSQAIFGEVQPHLHDDCILPDLAPLDLTTANGAVNARVLRELGARAEQGVDPLPGMPFFYRVAHADIHGFLRMSNANPPS